MRRSRLWPNIEKSSGLLDWDSHNATSWQAVVFHKNCRQSSKRARELNISWPLDESMTDTELQRLMFSKESKVSANKRMPDYDYIRKELLRNGVSKNSYGRNTWRIAVPMVKNHSCIHSSAITSNRMSRSIVLPCISTVNPVNRLKLTGQVILQQSLILIPAKSSRHTYLLV